MTSVSPKGCSLNPAAAADEKVSFQSAYTHDSSTSQPTINIEVASLLGVAVLNTGATESLASPGLYAILLKNGTSFTSARRTMGWPTGPNIHGRRIGRFSDKILLRNLVFCLTFNVVVDSTKVKVPFVRSYSLMSTSDAELMQVNTTGLALRENEGSKLSPAQRTQLNQLIISKAARFATEGPATSYATHHIRVGERQEAPADVRDNQLEDPELKTIVEDLEDSDPSRGRGWSERGYLMSDGVLYRELRAPSDVVADMKTIVDNDNFVPSITPYLRRLSTALLDARDVYEQAQSIRKKYADEGRRTPPDYKVGDLVLLKTQSMNDAGRGQTAKFIPRRDGPYRIREVVSPTTYVIEGLTRAEHIGRYHVSLNAIRRRHRVSGS
ncbi:hypothetical protein SFRURICE_019575 [Spodoptera frugiperda]|nr:hypothetical protein SFRURICE_019575 [Spodoptera frugiperda]